jgi:protein phosphatase 1 regulatory subunit 7
VWIRGLSDLSNIGNFKMLKTLQIQDQIRLANLHLGKGLTQLTDLKILNCKTLDLVTGVENLSSLQHLRIFQTNLDFDQFIKQSFPSSLKALAFYTNKIKVDAQIKERLTKMGYDAD